MKDGAIDEVRVFRTALTPAEVRFLHSQTSGVASPDVARQELVDVLVAGDPTRRSGADRAHQGARDAENELVSVLPQIMVMGDTPTPRPTYVLVRGNYEDHGEEVPPRGLGERPSVESRLAREPHRSGAVAVRSEESADLAVFVNRTWQMHFGRGLVETAEDFGSQGSIPTHPELLDSLAVSFRESGWDIKQLHKTIVMSATYRQQSDVSERFAEEGSAQPAAGAVPAACACRRRWCATRRWPPAACSCEQIGGPSAYPYQPDNMWDGFNVYALSRSPTRCRPTRITAAVMYSFVKRNAPHPAMATFDMPDRGSTAARRTRRTRRCRRSCCSTTRSTSRPIARWRRTC